MSLFQDWLLRKQGRNKESPGPPGPGEQPQTPDALADRPEQRINPPARTLVADAEETPWRAPLDPLCTGELRGVVPENWSREGWIMVTKDRMNRTNDPVVLALLRAELDAIEGPARNSKKKR